MRHIAIAAILPILAMDRNHQSRNSATGLALAAILALALAGCVTQPVYFNV